MRKIYERKTTVNGETWVRLSATQTCANGDKTTLTLTVPHSEYLAMCAKHDMVPMSDGETSKVRTER